MSDIKSGNIKIADLDLMRTIKTFVEVKSNLDGLTYERFMLEYVRPNSSSFGEDVFAIVWALLSDAVCNRNLPGYELIGRGDVSLFVHEGGKPLIYYRYDYATSDRIIYAFGVLGTPEWGT